MESAIKTYHFTGEIEPMVERLRIWHSMNLKDGLTAEQSKHFLRELYLKCDEAFGWSLITYHDMVNRATK